MPGPNTDLEIPMWSKPASKASARRNRKQSFEIPLWVKPSCPNIEEYVSTVPLHQTKAIRHLAMQRVWSVGQCGWSPRSRTWRQDSDVELMHASSSESTSADGSSSDESSVVEETTATENSSDDNDGTGSSQAPPGCGSESEKREGLVAALRDARLHACAQRIGRGGWTTGDLDNAVVAEKNTCCKTEDLVTALRNVRLEVAARRRARIASPQEAVFTVTVHALNGNSHEISHLNSNTQIEELCGMVAKKLDIPDFAVRLLFGDQVLHMSQPGVSLGMVGIMEDAQVTLAKNYGWGKPDITKLAQLERQWRGEPGLGLDATLSRI